jgi:hypothetical protein
MKEIGNVVEIYFDDLTEDAQKKFLKAMRVETGDKGNYDILPIAIVPMPEIDDEKTKNEDIDSHKQSIQETKKAGIKYEDYQGSFQLFVADGR